MPRCLRCLVVSVCVCAYGRAGRAVRASESCGARVCVYVGARGAGEHDVAVRVVGAATPRCLLAPCPPPGGGRRRSSPRKLAAVPASPSPPPLPPVKSRCPCCRASLHPRTAAFALPTKHSKTCGLSPCSLPCQRHRTARAPQLPFLIRMTRLLVVATCLLLSCTVQAANKDVKVRMGYFKVRVDLGCDLGANRLPPNPPTRTCFIPTPADF